MKKRMILFICSGNICRSPMAEYMLKQRLGRNSTWKICSAGVMAGAGISASQSAMKVLKKRGIDMSAHISRQVTRELVDEASLIIVMTIGHFEEMRMSFPDAEQKLFLLNSFNPKAKNRDVADPMGANEDFYSEVYRQIEMALPGLIDFINKMK